MIYLRSRATIFWFDAHDDSRLTFEFGGMVYLNASQF